MCFCVCEKLCPAHLGCGGPRPILGHGATGGDVVLDGETAQRGPLHRNAQALLHQLGGCGEGTWVGRLWTLQACVEDRLGSVIWGDHKHVRLGCFDLGGCLGKPQAYVEGATWIVSACGKHKHRELGLKGKNAFLKTTKPPQYREIEICRLGARVLFFFVLFLKNQWSFGNGSLAGRKSGTEVHNKAALKRPRNTRTHRQTKKTEMWLRRGDTTVRAIAH